MKINGCAVFKLGTFIFLLGFTSCDFRYQIVNNHKPVAIIEISGTPQAGEEVELDASNSYDPDGDSINYVWYIITPDLYVLSSKYNRSIINLSLTVEGNYIIFLYVSDWEGNGVPDQYILSVYL